LRVLIVGLGGVTRVFRNWPERVIARALVGRGHAVRAVGMLYPGIPGLTDERDLIDGVEVRRVPQSPWPNRRLSSVLGEAPRPDVIHFFHPRNLLASQVMGWARRHHVPTVYTWNGPYHDPYLVDDRERPFDAPPHYERLIWTRGQLVRRLWRAPGPRAARDLIRNYRFHWPLLAAQHLVPCSRFEGEEMRRMGLTQPMSVVPQWIDSAAISAEPVAPPSVAASRPWILFVGQLSPRKGYDIALEAMPAILQRQPTASLLFVSGINTADRERLDSVAASLGIQSHVHVLGRLEDNPLANLFRCSDVYVTPTRYEGFGLTLLEAMALGAPVVCTDVPAANEIVRHEENGLCVRPADPGALAAAVLRLVEDAALRERLREGGRWTVAHDFDGGRLVLEIESAYTAARRAPGLSRASR
jgi:glycogen synthase